MTMRYTHLAPEHFDGVLDSLGAPRAHEKRGPLLETPEKVPLTRADVSGAKGTRTPDLLHAMQTRYQLRHSPSPMRALRV